MAASAGATGNAKKWRRRTVTLRFEQILADGIAQLSYLVGDDAAGVAAVVDPRPDVDVYLEIAQRYGLAITHIFETHIHADFMSGARELAARLGNAEIYVSHEGGAEYGFPHQGIRDGDRFSFGSAVLTARFTPGHTPEHLAYLVAEKGREDSPWGVLTGDSLFIDSVGRPDLLGDEMSGQLADQLFETMREFYLGLGDEVIVYPCHGAGSACGPDIGDRLSSTIGYERRHNPYLQCETVGRFKDMIFAEAPPVPRHYPRLKKVNAKGPEILGMGPLAPALPPDAFKAAIGRGDATLVDTRDMLAFGGGHIGGALNIPSNPILSVWAGWLLDPEKPVLLVLESDSDLAQVTSLLVRTGHSNIAGYLAGGMAAWTTAGFEIQKLGEMSVHELKTADDEVQILDVRAPDEWSDGHIPGAKHCFVPEILEHLPSVDRQRPVAVYCDSGYRAHIAASLLLTKGFTDVRAVPGSWQAWTAAGYPIEGKG